MKTAESRRKEKKLIRLCISMGSQIPATSTNLLHNQFLYKHGLILLIPDPYLIRVGKLPYHFKLSTCFTSSFSKTEKLSPYFTLPVG
jgi:hypothetical protein